MESMMQSPPSESGATENGIAPSTDAAPKSLMSHMPQTNMVVAGVASGLAVSAITATGQNLIGKLSKHPAFIFGLGLVTGYFVHKHRQTILATVNTAAERSKEFVLHQREHIEDLLAESRREAE